MKFNETFEELCDLYTEGGLWANINAKKKRGGKSAHGNSDAHKAAVKAGNKLEKGKSSDEEEDAEDGKDYRGRTPEQVAAIDKKIAGFKERSKKFAKENPYTMSGPSHASPAPRKQEDAEGKYDDGDGKDEKCDYVDCKSEDGEDNELARLVGKAALTAAKLAGKGAKEVAHFATDDKFRSKGEDCETCGCQEHPEDYGHFQDTYSSYIDHYEPKEDCETCGCEDAEAGCECGNCPDCTPKEDAERIDKDRMKCNSPKRGGSKKFVVKACENGKEKIVRFGDPNMKIRKSNPKARKSFRARHKCDQKKSKFSAGYWSCKKW